MSDLHLQSPLATLNGAPPAAPDWFSRALAVEPECGSVTVAGARIETLTWGEPGRPGLLFLHGSGAHAGWWRFIAPYFLPEWRVAALSWSGMGGSDWRERYRIDLFVEEAAATAAAAGLFAAGPPVCVAHSFGSFPLSALAAQQGERLKAVVLVDPPMFTPEREQAHRERREKRGPEPFRPHRVYPTLAGALARFRLAPVQPCENLYIADFIARGSLKPAPLPDGGEGWTWRFDPSLWQEFRIEDRWSALKGMRCPVALVRGAGSKLFRAEDAAYVRSLLPSDAPYLEVPEADHHVMIDQPLAFAAALRGLLAGWPRQHGAG